MDSDLNPNGNLIDLEGLFQQHEAKLNRGNFETREPKIWTVASGKGGVGKTFVATSLALTLSKLGKQVVLIDLDISGANVHTALGMPPQHQGLRQFLDGSKNLSECVTASNMARLSFIQGVWDTWACTDLTNEQVEKILNESKKLNCDYVIIDLGAGTMRSHLKAFTFADEKFLVTSPEHTSLEKNYRFLEAYLCEHLREFCNQADYDELIQALRVRREKQANQFFSFRTYLETHTNVQIDYFKVFKQAPIRLVVNSCRTEQNFKLGNSMKSVCKKFFDLPVDTSMSLEFDNAVWQSAKNHEPALHAQPFTSLAGQFLTTCKQLVDPQELQKVV